MATKVREPGWMGALDRLDSNCKLVHYMLRESLREHGMGDDWTGEISEKHIASATSLSLKNFDVAVRRLRGAGVILDATFGAVRDGKHVARAPHPSRWFRLAV